MLEEIALQPFMVFTVTFLIFSENDYSLKLSIGIIMVYDGTSNTKKVVVFSLVFFF